MRIVIYKGFEIVECDQHDKESADRLIEKIKLWPREEQARRCEQFIREMLETCYVCRTAHEMRALVERTLPPEPIVIPLDEVSDDFKKAMGLM